MAGHLMNKVEAWKLEKHGFDVLPDIEAYAARSTPMSEIAEADLERMKWYGLFYRKRVEDGRYMIRVRIPGCELDAAQTRALAEIARIGYSILDVTTRGNVQIQGFAIADLPRVLDALDAARLTGRQTGHDNVRNVMTHPWAGLDPEATVFDEVAGG
ncbi:MAG: ferredoxin--nitrite reductase, partial [Planctomycetota bacterium]|nr:ferredoxin--nitrite reductase [Planctomycetota bacterium]